MLARTSTMPNAHLLSSTNSASSNQPGEAGSTDFRYRVASELVATEAQYCDTLDTAIRVFMAPLRQMALEKRSGRVLSRAEVDAIFQGLEQIYLCSLSLRNELEKRMESYDSESTTLGDLFTAHHDEMLTYGEYVRHHKAAILCVNEQERRNRAFVNFCRDQMQKHELGLGLLAYLITPVQRMPRYRLLIKELLKHTAETHADYALLSDALQQVEKIAAEVNEAIREQENFQKVVSIQASFEGDIRNIVQEDRRYVRDGMLMKVCKKMPKARHFFLFSDVLVYGEEVGEQTYSFHRLIPLDECQVRDVDDSDQLRHAFQIISTEKSFTVFCVAEKEKQQWMAALRECIGEFRDLKEGEEAAPVWTPDTQTKACMLCDVKFTLTNRRHHCRRCGKCICGKCSPFRRKLSFLNEAKAVRVCVPCNQLLESEEAEAAADGDADDTPTGSRKSSISVVSKASSKGSSTPKRMSSGGGSARTSAHDTAERRAPKPLPKLTVDREAARAKVLPPLPPKRRSTMQDMRSSSLAASNESVASSESERAGGSFDGKGGAVQGGTRKRSPRLAPRGRRTVANGVAAAVPTLSSSMSHGNLSVGSDASAPSTDKDEGADALKSTDFIEIGVPESSDAAPKSPSGGRKASHALQAMSLDELRARRQSLERALSSAVLSDEQGGVVSVKSIERELTRVQRAVSAKSMRSMSSGRASSVLGASPPSSPRRTKRSFSSDTLASRELPCRVRVTDDVSSTKPGLLDVKSGQEIVLLALVSSKWASCDANGHRGLLTRAVLEYVGAMPADYVAPAPPPAPASKPPPLPPKDKRRSSERNSGGGDRPAVPTSKPPSKLSERGSKIAAAAAATNTPVEIDSASSSESD